MIIILVGMRVCSKVEAAWGDSIWMLDAAARSPAFCRDTDNMQPISKQPVQPNSEQSVVVVVVCLSRHAFDYSIRAAHVGRDLIHVYGELRNFQCGKSLVCRRCRLNNTISSMCLLISPIFPTFNYYVICAWGWEAYTHGWVECRMQIWNEEEREWAGIGECRQSKGMARLSLTLWGLCICLWII